MSTEVSQPYYRVLLTRELESRSSRNPRYSLRSFARDLALSPQRLSDLIRGRSGASAICAKLIGEKLGLRADELKRFVASAEMLHSRNPIRRQKAKEQFEMLTQNFSTLALDAFQTISDWYHYAILELTYTEGFKSNSQWIAKQLDLSIFIVDEAIKRLNRLEMLETDRKGNLKCTTEFIATPSGIPSDALRKFHRQLLEKAILALDFQTVAERDIASSILAINTEQLPEAKDELLRFRRSFTKKYGSASRQTDVYCLGIQFYSLQKGNKK